MTNIFPNILYHLFNIIYLGHHFSLQLEGLHVNLAIKQSIIWINKTFKYQQVSAMMEDSMNYTIIQSPINRFTDENIIQNAQTSNGINDGVNIKDLSSRLQAKINKIQNLQKELSSHKKPLTFKELKNQLINHKEILQPSTPFHIISALQTNGKEDNEDFTIIKKLHFEDTAKPNANQQKQARLGSFLQQIGVLKRSIAEIKQRYDPTRKSDQYKSFQYSSSNRNKKPSRYAPSQQKHNYTSYRTLLDNNISSSRWKSHDKSFNFLKNITTIQEFTIDASDIKKTIN